MPGICFGVQGNDWFTHKLVNCWEFDLEVSSMLNLRWHISELTIAHLKRPPLNCCQMLLSFTGCIEIHGH
eukprot:6469151-Amphidinium_carterae.1